MKVELFNFQKKALVDLRKKTKFAQISHQQLNSPQVISFTAPTGAGKTIIASALIENIFSGDELFPESPNSIILWLSDSPELNEQSKLKIETKADKIQIGQCITISDENGFDIETLEDGKVYFLNTQKLSTSSNLTKHSDGRQYTIWETLQNTIIDKGDRLILIIDEAHRGAKENQAARQTTIMQKFIKGSPVDKLSPMPVTIGMSATPERFNRLISGCQSSTHYVAITPDEVRQSGLLKDKIIVSYPEDGLQNKEIAVLQQASLEWRDKCLHWFQYCEEQHYRHVYPIFVIQVENGRGNQLSNTDLDECLKTIETTTGNSFTAGEVVHTFGDTRSIITINNIDVRYEEPSQIQEDRNIKVVFFKETLSTGWDCPRAETMMSFRRAVDATYIAQLLGRMVRTPLQMHIKVDESLNNVNLFLPNFDKETVESVVRALHNAEGAYIPADIVEEGVGGSKVQEILSVKPMEPKKETTIPQKTDNVPAQPIEVTSVQKENSNTSISSQNSLGIEVSGNEPSTDVQGDTTKPEDVQPTTVQPSLPITKQPTSSTEGEEWHQPSFDPLEIRDAINNADLLTYDIRKARINDYLRSLFKLAHLLSQTNLYKSAVEDVLDYIVKDIKSYIDGLKEANKYDELVKKALTFKLTSKEFDVFGESINKTEEQSLFTTNADIERQFRQADTLLYNEGIGQAYGKKYYDPDDPDSYMLHVILYAADEACRNKLLNYAEARFHELSDTYRPRTKNLTDKQRSLFNDITRDGDEVSKHLFNLPEHINVDLDKNGQQCYDHLFLNKYGIATFNLNQWESGLLDVERKRSDYVCWLRNQERKPWALCLPYKMNNEVKGCYPDMLIVRKDNSLGYVIDIMEPHGDQFKDNLAKAQGLAYYAQEANIAGRIQLIRKIPSPIGNRFIRLDLNKSAIRKKVLSAMTNEELDHLFTTDGES